MWHSRGRPTAQCWLWRSSLHILQISEGERRHIRDTGRSKKPPEQNLLMHVANPCPAEHHEINYIITAISVLPTQGQQHL